AGRVHLRPQGPAAHHALPAAPRCRRAALVLLRCGPRARRQARPAALPAAAELQEGAGPPGGDAREPARRISRGLRVPPRELVRRRGLRAAPRAQRRAVYRRHRGRRDAGDRHRGLRLPQAPRRRVHRRRPAALDRDDRHGRRRLARRLRLLQARRHGLRPGARPAVPGAACRRDAARLIARSPPRFERLDGIPARLALAVLGRAWYSWRRYRTSEMIRDFFLGFIRIHVLHHAAEGPVYGLWLIEELGRHGYALSPGTLYPILRDLADGGYLRLERRLVSGRVRKYYRITPGGRRAL